MDKNRIGKMLSVTLITALLFLTFSYIQAIDQPNPPLYAPDYILANRIMQVAIMDHDSIGKRFYLQDEVEDIKNWKSKFIDLSRTELIQVPMGNLQDYAFTAYEIELRNKEAADSGILYILTGINLNLDSSHQLDHWVGFYAFDNKGDSLGYGGWSCPINKFEKLETTLIGEA